MESHNFVSVIPAGFAGSFLANGVSISRPMIDTGLNGKVALVTGGNSGIGAAICTALAAEGVRVAIHFHPGDTREEFLHAIPGESAAFELVDKFRSLGREAVAIGADLLEPDEVTRLFDETERLLGPVDILVNNAAHCEQGDFLTEINAGIIDRHFAVNTRAAILLSKLLADRKGEGNGSIVNLSTDSSRVFPGQIAYGASKHALESLTRSLSMELGKSGIRVNAVSPGPIQTGWITPELEHQILNTIPLQRLGTPLDVAECVVFLCSRQASWITGQVIQVAGGHAL